MQEQLSELRAEVDRQNAEVERLVADRSDDDLLRRTPEGRWSVAEHLEHLVLTNSLYLDRVETALEKARKRGLGGSGPFRTGWFMRWFIGSMEPPVTRRFRTVKKIVPAPGLDPARVREAFEGAQRRLGEALTGGDGIDLDRARMRSPLLALLRMSTFEAFELMAAHNRRHIWHIRGCLEPRSGLTASSGEPGEGA